MSEPREIELKLEPEDAAAEDFERMLSATLGRPPSDAKPLRSTYFDTRKHGLRRRGFSFRVRQDGERHVQTLKEVGSAGLLDRAEWESDVAADIPDPVRFADTRPREILDARGRLGALFAVAVQRTTWIVRHGRSTVEVAFDRGSVEAGGRTEPLAEIEIELKRGSARDLFRLARRLAATDGVRLGVRSKSDRGYALIDGTDGRPAKAEPPRLDRSMTAGHAFATIAWSCLREFRLHEAALTARREAESLHGARVAIRRLRSALSIFVDVVADSQVDAIKGRLSALSGKLGEARNLDVYLADQIAPKRDRLLPEPVLDAYADRVMAARERAYDAVVAHLGSKEFRLFMIELAGWIEAGPWRADAATPATRDQPAWAFAKAELRRRGKALNKKGRRLEGLDSDGRHRVRIAAKKLRYASEFFVILLGGDRARRRQARFVSRVQELQDRLGELNDLRIGHDVARRLTEEVSPEAPAVPFAAGLVTSESKEREETLLRAAEAAHRRLRRARPF